MANGDCHQKKQGEHLMPGAIAFLDTLSPDREVTGIESPATVRIGVVELEAAATDATVLVIMDVPSEG